MATYGLDYYAKAFYGGAVLIDYAVTDLAATQIDFGHVRVSWTMPVQNVWTQLALVRSRYGFPVSVLDGDLLATYSSTTASTSYTDLGLTPGYWYYGVFAAVPLAAWSASLTYQAGDRVSYSAQDWIALQIAPAGTTPAAGAYWAVSQEVQIWQPAGAVATLSVADHGYDELMNTYIPNAYRAAPVLTTDSTAINDDLADFLAILAWGFEIAGTETDDLYHLYDTSTTRYDRLLQISTMLGVSVEGASSPRYQRLRTARAAELGREKGTERGLVDLIEAATGLSCTVTTGPNMLLGRDQSDFPYPLYPVWESDESYTVGDLVTYQGARYVCIPWSLGPTLTGTPNTATTGTFSSLPYTLETSSSNPASLGCSFQVPKTGVYVLQFTVLTGPANGFAEVLMDAGLQTITPIADIATLDITASGFHTFGTGSVAGPIDTYSAATAVGTTYVCPMNLVAGGSHNLLFLSSTKDSSSTGYGVQISGVTLTAQWTSFAPSSTPPTNAGAHAGVQWAPPPAAAQASYANPVTGQASTWSSTQGAVSLAVDYLGAIGLSMDTSWLTVANGSLALNSVYSIASASYPLIASYSGGTAYVAGRIVVGPDGQQYTALAATTGNAPPNPLLWERSGYASPYDRELIAQSATPTRAAPPYDPQASYAEGQMVTYNQALYVAPAATRGVTPPASPDCNSGWEYVGPEAGRIWIASLYNPVPTTGTLPVYPGLEFYDTTGQPITSASLMTSTGALTTTLPVFARLIEPSPDLSGAALDAGPHNFTVSTAATWGVASGAAAVSPAYSGSGTQILLLYTDSGMSDGCVGTTFVTDVANKTVRDVGIIFRLSDTSHFAAAFRDQLLTYSSGTKTVLATYTRLPVGTRMFVQLAGSTIKLYAYPGAGAAPTLITTVTSTFNQTSTTHGVVDWTW